MGVMYRQRWRDEHLQCYFFPRWVRRVFDWVQFGWVRFDSWQLGRDDFSPAVEYSYYCRRTTVGGGYAQNSPVAIVGYWTRRWNVLILLPDRRFPFSFFVFRFSVFRFRFPVSLICGFPYAVVRLRFSVGATRRRPTRRLPPLLLTN